MTETLRLYKTNGMTEERNTHDWQRRGIGLVERLDKMVAAGRLTEEEAGRLRAAAGSGELDDAAREIQLKHARARVREALEGGHLSQEEADAIFCRLEDGEDPRFLRGLRRRFRPGMGRPG